MFINDIRFINTISRDVKFMTAEHIANVEVLTLQELIRQFKKVYMQQVFNITKILMDGQFSFIVVNLAELYINIKICSNN